MKISRRNLKKIISEIISDVDTGRSRGAYRENPYGPGGVVKRGFFKDDWKGTWDEEMVRFGYEDAVDGLSPEYPDRKDYMEGYESGQDKAKGVDWNEGY
tara:strand:+ start:1771 stop:2067 length:297 start_codon:yes stop_codon:yes gene_type:complete